MPEHIIKITIEDREKKYEGKWISSKGLEEYEKQNGDEAGLEYLQKVITEVYNTSKKLR